MLPAAMAWQARYYQPHNAAAAAEGEAEGEGSPPCPQLVPGGGATLVAVGGAAAAVVVYSTVEALL